MHMAMKFVLSLLKNLQKLSKLQILPAVRLHRLTRLPQSAGYGSIVL